MITRGDAVRMPNYRILSLTTRHAHLSFTTVQRLIKTLKYLPPSHRATMRQIFNNCLYNSLGSWQGGTFSNQVGTCLYQNLPPGWNRFDLSTKN